MIMTTLEKIAEELHKPARKTFPRRKIVSLFKNDLWQSDLLDVQSYSKYNEGYKFILIVIDTYTKYLWVQALKNKSAKEVTQGMENILKINHPKLLQTDNGTEFYNKQFQDLMTKYNIKHYSTFSGIKAAIAERVIRTIKNKIYKMFTANGSYNWYNSISNIIHNYNNTIHRTIKCTPHKAQINTNNIKLNTNKLKKKSIHQSKYKINDKVRISKYKHIFSKGYTPNWTTEIFTISKIFQTNPVTYQLKDASENIIRGCFYEQEIKLTNFPDTFLIERIIKKNKNKMFVKWLGLGSEFNSYVNSTDILK